MRLKNISLLYILLVITICFINGCAVNPRRVPLGMIPRPSQTDISDDNYCRFAFESLTESYPLSRNSAETNRVQRLVDRLLSPLDSRYDRWKIYVLQSPQIVNAGATRGNCIFVWSGLLRTLRSDEDLSSVLAHEIAHVLAEHTRKTPGEQLDEAIASVSGAATRAILQNSPNGSARQYAGIAQNIVTTAMKGLIINPRTQAQELEADEIGLFIMTKAGYHPLHVIEFWEKVQGDPRFGANSWEFLSTHPSSESRLRSLVKALPIAMERYRDNSKPKSNNQNSAIKLPSKHSQSIKRQKFPRGREAFLNSRNRVKSSELETTWQVTSSRPPVYENTNSTPGSIWNYSNRRRVLLDRLRERELIIGECKTGNWLKITRPLKGYISLDQVRPATDINTPNCYPLSVRMAGFFSTLLG